MLYQLSYTPSAARSLGEFGYSDSHTHFVAPPPYRRSRLV